MSHPEMWTAFWFGLGTMGVGFLMGVLVGIGKECIKNHKPGVGLAFILSSLIPVAFMLLLGQKALYWVVVAAIGGGA